MLADAAGMYLLAHKCKGTYTHICMFLGVLGVASSSPLAEVSSHNCALQW